MSIKSEADWRGLRRAADVARETLDALEAYVRAGITTGDLDAVASAIFKKRGARSAPALVYGFPGTVLISVNDEIVHGVPGTRALRAGDLVKLDVTVERDGYISDAARSVIIEAGSQAAARLRACGGRARRPQDQRHRPHRRARSPRTRFHCRPRLVGSRRRPDDPRTADSA